ncbi:MAG: hypothetical protein KatS3mg115_0351 [Candidatus Poribacteria bacterium]|nr:MAG: hypothetical protein KatS3mg115_0351 [Candidatus Poribacteria bacterium]
MRAGRQVSRRIRLGLLLLIIWGVAPLTGGAQEAIDRSRQNAIVQAVRRVSPAVVNISSTHVMRRYVLSWWNFLEGGDPFGIEEERYQSLGSGVIFDAERGYVLTNQHVVEGADEIAVRLHDGRSFAAELVGQDAYFDLAVLRIEGKDLPEAPFGDSDALQIGEWAIAIGNPFGRYVRDLEPSVTVGVISATDRVVQVEGRTYTHLVQTDAAINPGNSGGPLVNAQGEVIGINTFILSESGGSHGVNFALEINVVKRVIPHLIRRGRVVEPWFGMLYADLSPEQARALKAPRYGAVLITYVRPGSPASRAGVQKDDLLVRVGSERIYFARQARGTLRLAWEGEPLPVTVLRRGREVTLTLTPSSLPEDFSFYGAVVREPERGLLLVDRVEENSLFFRVLQRGDVLLQLGSVRLRSLAQLRELAYQVEPEGKYRLTFQRGRNLLYVDFSIAIGR